MKKRSISFTAAVILLILSMFTACSGTRASEKTQATPVPTEQPGIQGENTPDPTEKPGIQGENTPAPTEQPEVTVGLSRPLSDGINPLERGRALTGLSVVGEDSPYYCNLEDNMMQGGYYTDFPVLLCPDPVYGITYYVNYGRDYFIYALRDGVSEPAVEAPARELYCKDGELYFLLDSYDLYEFTEVEQGNILKYNPADGSVEIVIGEPAVDMAVYSDGIIYETHEIIKTYEDGNSSYYHHRFLFSFTEKKVRELAWGATLACWKGYHLVQKTDKNYSIVGIYLENSEGEFVRDLKNMNVLPYMYLIKGESIYYIEKSPGKCSLMSYHLETGKKTVIAELGVNVSLFNGFMIQNDVVHFGSHLTVFLTEGVQAYTLIEGGSMGPGSTVSGFFTDGEEMYGIVGGKFRRMAVSKIETDDPLKQPLLHRGPDGYDVNLLYNAYEYRLYPIGEE